jgi:ketosteroid isomerase-like protein
MTEHAAILERAYKLFNDRDVDALLSMMTDDVEWPDVANWEVLHGKEAVRLYWEGQFTVTDPRVRPIAFIPAGDDLVAVINQRILDRQGQLLMPTALVFHRYTFHGDLVCRMVVFSDRDQAMS